MASVFALMMLFLASVCMLSLCQGRTLGDVEEERDDEDWPVLCPPDTFFNKTEDKCQTCSSCPMNQIITSPCQSFHDTSCGPFYDFKLFLPAGAVPSKEQNDADKSDSTFKDLVKNEPKQNKRPKDKTSAPDRGQTSENGLDSSDPEWRSLTYVLIIVIFIFMIIIIPIIGGIFFFRRKILNDKKIICEYSHPPVQV